MEDFSTQEFQTGCLKENPLEYLGSDCFLYGNVYSEQVGFLFCRHSL